MQPSSHRPGRLVEREAYLMGPTLLVVAEAPSRQEAIQAIEKGLPGRPPFAPALLQGRYSPL